MERTSWWRGWHELREGGIVLGTARPLGFWRRSMSVEFRGAMYELAPASFWSRGWRLVGEAGQSLLEIYPRGVFTRDAVLRVRAPVNADLLVFAFYLTHVRWQGQTAAASAAAGS